MNSIAPELSTSHDCKCVFGGPKIRGRGPIDSPIVVVGESPGAIELAKQTVFVGPSGTVINEAVEAAYKTLGIEKGDPRWIEPYFTNAIQCFPRGKDESKVITATSACAGRLIEEIKAFPRKVIITLGNAAAWSLTGDYSLKITKVRGTAYKSKLAEFGIVATVHPAYLLRGAGNLKQFKDDITFAISKAIESDASRTRSSGESLSVPFKVIQTEDELTALMLEMGSLPDGSVIGSDIETASFNYYTPNTVRIYPEYTENPILCTGFYWESQDECDYGKQHCYIIPAKFFDGPFKPVKFFSRLKYAWHNGKFDIKFFWHQGIEARVDEDTMLQSYALNERRGIHDLDQVAADHLGTPRHKDMLEQHLPKKKMSYANIPPKVLYEYLAYDVYKTWHINRILREKVRADQNSEKLYSKLFIPASAYLAEIEMNGMPVDLAWTNKNLEEMTAEANGYEANMNSYAREHTGADINPRSPLQLKGLLYDILKLGKPGMSTDEDTLLKLPPHPFVQNLLKYRKVHKGLSTYVEAPLRLIAPDGRIHTSYLIHGTVTGRLASRDPNLQNVPRLPKLRGQYQTLPGHVFIEPDLNQAELRSLACMSGDTELCRIYNTEGMSLHDEVRDFIFGTPKDWDLNRLEMYLEQFNVNESDPEKNLYRLRDEQKMIAKNVNFGIVYGITSFGLAEQIERPAAEAAQYIAAWFTRFPGAKKFIDSCMLAAAEGRNIITPYGRKKRAGIITMEKLRDLQNEAANFPHQATASDFVLDTGIRIRHTLKTKFKTTVHNTVHDSILLMTPNDIPLIKEVVEYTTSELSETPKMMGMTLVPFKADAKIGNRWGHLKGSKEWFKLQEEVTKNAA